MHAILQKHHLRPATQPSGSRDGKPARSSLPPPAPTVQMLMSSRAPPTADHHQRQQQLPPTGLPPVPDHYQQTTGSSHRGRLLTSGSGRRYYVASVEELLQPNAACFAPRTAEPAAVASVAAAAAAGGGARIPDTRNASSAEGHRCDSGIPRMRDQRDVDDLLHHSHLAAEVAAMSDGATPVGGGGLGSSMHHKLAEELAKLARWQATPHEPVACGEPLNALLFNSSISSRSSAHQQRPQLSSRGNAGGGGGGTSARLTATPCGGSLVDANDHRTRGGCSGPSMEGSLRGCNATVQHASHSSSKRRLSQWAAFAEDASVSELHTLLKAVIVQLLRAGAQPCQTLTQDTSSSSPHQRPVGSQGRGEPCGNTASVVFHRLCATFAEATGTAAPPVLRSAPPPPPLQQQPCTSAASRVSGEVPQGGAASSLAEDPSDDLCWQASPRPSTSGHATALPRFVSGIRGGGSTSPQGGGLHADDAVVLRQLAILRRERDESRREVEELRAELHRRTAL